MDSEKDNSPELIDSGLELIDMNFSHNGLFFAISGTKKSSGKQVPVVLFYSAAGQLLRALKVPGKDLFHTILPI